MHNRSALFIPTQRSPQFQATRRRPRDPLTIDVCIGLWSNGLRMTTTRRWLVTVECRRPREGAALIPGDPRLTDALAAALAPYGGIVSISSDMWAACITVETSAVDKSQAIVEAMQFAAATVSEAARSSQVPQWGPDRVEILNSTGGTEYQGPSAGGLYDFVGGAEVAAMLGISRQRLHQLRQEGRFPDPTFVLGTTPVWLRTAIQAFQAGWLRQPGRPRVCLACGETLNGTGGYAVPDQQGKLQAALVCMNCSRRRLPCFYVVDEFGQTVRAEPGLMVAGPG